MVTAVRVAALQIGVSFRWLVLRRIVVRGVVDMVCTSGSRWVSVRVVPVVAVIVLVRLSVRERIVVICRIVGVILVLICTIARVVGIGRKVVIGHTGNIVGIRLEIPDELLSLHIG